MNEAQFEDKVSCLIRNGAKEWDFYGMEAYFVVRIRYSPTSYTNITKG